MGKTIQVFGFPYLVSAEVVKLFLEKQTGNGTVYALEVKQSKRGPRAFAIVQFTNSRSADIIINLASQRLDFGYSYLRAWEMKTDNVKLRTYVQRTDGITLNFRCQISDDKFAVLGSSRQVSIEFGVGLKRIYFLLSCGSVDYKLQLSYENIWQIVLHHPYGQNAQFLLIQLRDNSVWMFASRPGLTANDIRTWMGDFQQIRNVAKYAARLGQSFGSSRETLSVGRDEIEQIPDVKVHGTNYVFSDGIGKISADFARRVATKCGLQYTPSAFQIRYGGYKGVVAVDQYSSMKLSLRKSMLKYEANNIKLDVLAWSKYQPCYLNRELVTLLSTLGVKDYVFEQKQNEAVEQLDAILHDSFKAQEALELMSPGENTNILKGMLNCGYMPDEEPFLSMMLQAFRASKLLDLRTKTRIFIPNGRAMMGCLDESRTLEYGQVFVQFTGAGRRQFYEDLHPLNDSRSANYNFILKGNVVVAKNPCLHPGDIRVLRAVDIPALHHMVDCVVFPQKGKRPHPNECSGSDLDGDIYFVCWDQDLIPPRQVQAMDYSPAPNTELDHDVTIEEVEEYFTNYIVNDSLGIIAHAHVAVADTEPDMAMSEPCKELAQLYSIAVDFPKTGVPAEIPSRLRPKKYPDFMEKPDKPTYHSERVLGKLFRKVKDKTPQSSSIATFTREVARRSYDADLEVYGFEDYIDEAFDYKTQYDNKLGNMMDYYGIETEAEILSGGIMKVSNTFDRRRDAEAIRVAVRSLRKEARTWFKRRGDIDDMLAKASAWYHVTYHPRYWGCYNEGLKRYHFISFPWCVYDQLIQIKKEKARNRPVPHLSSLGHQLSLMELI
ncbi:RNA-dependent RNA polymerase 1-like isoform X2 [Lycium barbarum]|uniref:RNA-dependent RNA polymerase 1-like isoform X2 n=1 Tax=Lycium barbarum TaxID=112863 RepID=UPI00293ECFDC|nr:RNA-dependent RNA polymerase 1-like isoform X2 [Lycium barbarum]